MSVEFLWTNPFNLGMTLEHDKFWEKRFLPYGIWAELMQTKNSGEYETSKHVVADRNTFDH